MSDAIDKSHWLNLEINGQPVQLPPGSTVMDAANLLKVFIPHFCYHKKLSIAANCRMCLVQVDKIPKPVPACATQISEGMKVWTRSEMALAAQQSVMEFLLINHPLDCPICDQGGECQLQDLAVGYGKGTSTFHEVKRAVPAKNLGPLVSAQEMSRCIQCTRCVRFGDEIAGKMELGMVQRGDRSEIVPFVGETVDSELSGNMIDLCPVGALTSKPFRYQARTWELERRKSVSPHDAYGSNLIVQLKRDKVVRVVPLNNEEINECWLSDKDRFSYEGLNSPERLTKPLMKKDGVLVETEWQGALLQTAAHLKSTVERHGAEALGVLVSPHATLEEAGLLARLTRALGCENIDSRLRRHDFSQDHGNHNVAWLGMPIAAVSQLKAALFVGSFLRHDHPLLAARVRQATKQGAKITNLHAVRADWYLPLARDIVVPPSQLVAALAEMVVAAHRAAEIAKALPAALQGIEPSAVALATVGELMAHPDQAAVFVGSLAQQHPQAGLLQTLAQLLAEYTGATLSVLPEAANSVGTELVGAVPQAGGLNTQAMLEAPRRAYVLLHAEVPFDVAQGATALQAMRQADFVLSLSPFRPQGDAAAFLPDIILPIAPFTETSGTFINMEGRVQAFRGVAPLLGETRPGWQVLCALAALLEKPFAEDTPERVRASLLPSAETLAMRLSNYDGGDGERIEASLRVLDKHLADKKKNTEKRAEKSVTSAAPTAIERVAAVPIYAADSLVRRAPSLQRTPLAAAPLVQMPSALAAELGHTRGAQVRVRQNDATSAVLTIAIDDSLPPNTMRLDMAHPSTAMLDCHGDWQLEVVAADTATVGVTS